MKSFEDRAYDLNRVVVETSCYDPSDVYELGEKADKLITAQKELIGFYSNYISGLNGYLHAHNMAPSKADIETGERLRAKIEELER